MSRLLNQLTQLFSVCTSSFFPQCFEIGVYLQMSDKGTDIGEGLTLVLEQVWRVLSVAIFPLLMIFALLVQRKTSVITDLRDSFYFSYASLFDHYC